MCVLSFEDGMTAESWYAWLAFRRRVSMSAMGSVIVMACGASLAAVPRALGLGDLARGLSANGDAWVVELAPLQGPVPSLRGAGGSGVLHQLDLRTPGSSPAWAISRRQIRHRPNLRKTECGRPQRWQRV